MQAEESFDSFYLATRRQLLHQTFALTGDLPASQSAVRDSYVAAWHHWRKVASMEDREAWVRGLAWNHAQRRHAGRIWHRNRGLAAEHRAVLDALSKLSTPQRRMLLLIQLAGAPLPQAARELGLTQPVAERHLQSATATLSAQLGVEPASLRAALLGLAAPLADTSLPRGTIIRRAGRKRRQLHTAAAVLAVAALAVTTGVVAHEPARVATAGPGVDTEPRPGIAVAPVDSDAEGTLPTADNMLDQDQIRRLGLRQRWRVVRTHSNTSGDGINTICQQARFADPDGLAAIVREFEARGKVRRSAVQTVEISATPEQARKAFRTTLGWYAGCQVSRLQLLEAYRVKNIGDQAGVLMIRVWKRPVTTYSVAVARTGAVVTTTVGRYVGVRPPAAGQITQSLADAVAMLCASSGAEDCAKRPEFTVVPPPPSGEEAGILAVADLPPVGRINKPWVGTEATVARPNPAMTPCDRADFAAAGARKPRTRTYLIPEARVPARFGLSETIGTFRKPAQAQRFLDRVRGRVAGCEDRELSTTVTSSLGGRRGPGVVWSAWELETEVKNDSFVRFRLGFVRVGKRVAQLTFAPAAGRDMTDAQFRALLVRAGDRLRELG